MPDEQKMKVVIIGGGAAGVFTAYLLKKLAPNDCFDIQILESGTQVGGHTISYGQQRQSQHVNIDGGAQFFSETAQPNYCAMLRDEKFFAAGDIIQRDVGVTIWDETKGTLLFRIPPTVAEILTEAIADPFNWLNFIRLTEKAIVRHLSGNWNETFGQWLASVPLLGNAAKEAAFKTNIARPLMYQFGLVPPLDLDSLSAKFVVYYYVGSLPWSGNVAAPFNVYNSAIGLDGVLDELLNRSGVIPRLDSKVKSIAPKGNGYVVTPEKGPSLDADEVVFAVNPTKILQLLPADASFDAVRNALKGMPYVTVPVHIQDNATPMYMPPKAHQSVSNVLVIKNPAGNAATYMLSVWFGPLRTQSIAQDFVKSWGSPSLVPPNAPWIIRQNHELMIGTPGFIANRETLRTLHQGNLHLWYSGGYIVDYDSQDACLRSAGFVADALIQKCIQAPAPAVAETASMESDASMESGARKVSALADQVTAEAFALEKRRPALFDEIERVIMASNPGHPAVLEWLESGGRNPD